MDAETTQLLRDVRDQLAVSLAWPGNEKLRSRIRMAVALHEGGKDKFSRLHSAASDGAAMLERVHGIFPSMIGAKEAAKAIRESL